LNGLHRRFYAAASMTPCGEFDVRKAMRRNPAAASKASYSSVCRVAVADVFRWVPAVWDY